MPQRLQGSQGTPVRNTGQGSGWPSSGLPIIPQTGHSTVTHLFLGFLVAVQPLAEMASGPGACCGLSWDLQAEEGGM